MKSDVLLASLFTKSKLQHATVGLCIHYQTFCFVLIWMEIINLSWSVFLRISCLLDCFTNECEYDSSIWIFHLVSQFYTRGLAVINYAHHILTSPDSYKWSRFHWFDQTKLQQLLLLWNICSNSNSILPLSQMKSSILQKEGQIWFRRTGQAAFHQNRLSWYLFTEPECE